MIANRLKTLLLDNFLIKIASLAFAVILWFYVSTRGGAETEITVPLELRNIPDRLIVIGDQMETVNVRLRGSERILQEVASRPIRAVLDLTNATAGDNVFTLERSAIAVPAQVRISQINPPRIRIRMAPRTEPDPSAH